MPSLPLATAALLSVLPLLPLLPLHLLLLLLFFVFIFIHISIFITNRHECVWTMKTASASEDPGLAGLQSQQLNALDDFFVELKANCLLQWKAAFETVCQRFYFEGDAVAKMVVHIFECSKALPVGEAELPLPIDTATYASLIKDLASIGFVQMPHGSAGAGGAGSSYVLNKETWAMILPDCILE